jgi:trimeric autotransporter adhesin
MKGNEIMKNRHATCTIILLVCSVILPAAQAVNPPPDGGYANFTTAEGTNALLDLTSGTANTGVGWSSLLSVTTGSFNTATGAGALLFNTVDENTAFGAAALLFNTIGFKNTAVGSAALLNNTEGNLNTAIGSGALVNNMDGNSDTATGAQALQDNITGSGNTAVGRSALIGNTTGDTNTAIGINALQNNSTGSNNIALGGGAGAFLTTGDNNIDIGNVGAATEANTIHIGTQGTQAVTYIAGISEAVVVGTPVLVDDNGRLGVAVSSQRFKEEIKPMNTASEVLFALKPVTFRYKEKFDSQQVSQFGLVAEDVEKVNPDLVKRDRDGMLKTVRYDAVNAMLLNEFLKEHQTVQEQKTTIAELKSTVEKQEATNAQQQKQIELLIAGLQRVTAQIDRPWFANNP